MAYYRTLNKDTYSNVGPTIINLILFKATEFLLFGKYIFHRMLYTLRMNRSVVYNALYMLIRYPNYIKIDLA